MLFHKSLLSELRSTTGGLLAVLTTTFVTMTVIRVLGRVASGKVESELVVPLIVFNTLSQIGSVVMIAVYIAVLLVLSRWWRDSEMVIWLSSGRSLANFVAPIKSFLLPMVALVAFLSFVAGPWARYQMAVFEDAVEKRNDAQRASPGQFRESLSGQRIFFLEKPDDETGKIGAVFIRSVEPDGSQAVVASKAGHFETDDAGQSWVVLQRGYRSDLAADGLESGVTEFATYRVRLDPSAPLLRPQDAARTTPTWELWSRDDAAAKGEMVFRIGIPLITIALAFIAIPLSVSSARSGRAVNLIVALLIYLIVSNLLGTVRVATAQGRIDFALAWWPLPLAVFVIAVVMLQWRMSLKRSAAEMMWLLLRKIPRRTSLRSQ